MKKIGNVVSETLTQRLGSKGSETEFGGKFPDSCNGDENIQEKRAREEQY